MRVEFDLARLVDFLVDFRQGTAAVAHIDSLVNRIVAKIVGIIAVIQSLERGIRTSIKYPNASILWNWRRTAGPLQERKGRLEVLGVGLWSLLVYPPSYRSLLPCCCQAPKRTVARLLHRWTCGRCGPAPLATRWFSRGAGAESLVPKPKGRKGVEQ